MPPYQICLSILFRYAPCQRSKPSHLSISLRSMPIPISLRSMSQFEVVEAFYSASLHAMPTTTPPNRSISLRSMPPYQICLSILFRCAPCHRSKKYNRSISLRSTPCQPPPTQFYFASLHANIPTNVYSQLHFAPCHSSKSSKHSIPLRSMPTNQLVSKHLIFRFPLRSMPAECQLSNLCENSITLRYMPPFEIV